MSAPVNFRRFSFFADLGGEGRVGVEGTAFSLLGPFLNENFAIQEDGGWLLYIEPRVEVDHLERNRLVAEDAVEIVELLRRNWDWGRSWQSSEKAKLEGVIGRSSTLSPRKAAGEYWYASKIESRGELG